MDMEIDLIEKEELNIKQLFTINDSLLLRLLCVHYPFELECLKNNLHLLKAGNCIFSDGFDFGARLVSKAKYGLCFNCNISTNFFIKEKDNLNFELESFTNYDLAGYAEPAFLPLDINYEIECIKRYNDSLISELEYLNQDFHNYLKRINQDEWTEDVWQEIERQDKERSAIINSMNCISEEYKISGIHYLKSLIETSSDYLALNKSFYNELISFLNILDKKWFDKLFINQN